MVVIKRIRCPVCNSSEVRATLSDFYCRHCGYRFAKERVPDLRVDKKESEEKVKRIEF